MAFTPNTRVYLLDTPLDNNYKHQLHFDTVSAQHSYFNGRIKHSFEGVTYQRKNNVARVDAHIDSLWNVNYCMYQNTGFGTKWFYAFITKMEYVSDRATDVYLETDVYQTWLFDTNLQRSFIVREHVDSDEIGEHLIDEQLETGEYKMYEYRPSGEMGDNWNILAVSDNGPMGFSVEDEELIGNKYGEVVTGFTYYPFPNTSAGITWLKDIIKTYTEAGKVDAIAMIFTVPWLIIRAVVDHQDWFIGKPMWTGAPYGFTFFFEPKQLTNLDGYVPKNKKMLTYPYKFFYVSNADGGSATFRYEDFNTPDSPNDLKFAMFGSINPNPSVMLAPYDHKGSGLMYEYGLTLQGFPLGSWVTDTYAAWLAQHAAGTAITLVGSAATIGAGLVSGNVLAVGGGALAVGHQLTQLRMASIQPDQAKGQAGNGNLMFGTQNLDFYFAHMGIKAEFAQKIDDYFTMYGYKVNAVKVPKRHSRLRWNYLQTIDVNIIGDIPVDDMTRLKKVYDDGVTLWHSPQEMFYYAAANPIIS